MASRRSAHLTPDSLVKYSVSAAVGTICINRPDDRNAIDARVMERLETILYEIETNPGVRVLIVTAAGARAFCAGGDLDYFRTLRGRRAGLAMARRMQAILYRLHTGDRVVIAAINGKAIGGACEILTACHLRVASARSSFAFLHARNGLTTGWGGGLRLIDLIGRGQASRLLLTGEEFDAREAHRIGFVDMVTPTRRALNVARDIAARVAQNAPGSVRAFQQLLRAAAGRRTKSITELETRLFGEAWVSEEFISKLGSRGGGAPGETQGRRSE